METMVKDKSKQRKMKGIGTLAWYIEKYGEEGIIKWKNRQIKWQETLNKKSIEELKDLNSKKQ